MKGYLQGEWSEFHVGDTITYIGDKHEKYPASYPKPGTKGEVVKIREDNVLRVKWERGFMFGDEERWVDEKDVERKIMFTKNDLKTGDLLKDRCNDLKRVMLGTDFGDIVVYPNSKFYGRLSNYNNDLTNKQTNSRDITEAYRPKYEDRVTSTDLDDYTLVYQREKTKEMTVAEVSEALGYDIKIVKA